MRIITYGVSGDTGLSTRSARVINIFGGHPGRSLSRRRPGPGQAPAAVTLKRFVPQPVFRSIDSAASYQRHGMVCNAGTNDNVRTTSFIFPPMSPRPAPTGRRRWLRWVLLAIAVIGAWQVMTGPRGLLKVSDLRAQKRAILREIDSLEARRAELLAERQRLLTDTAYLEHLARRELGMARPGERVYRFPAPAEDSGKAGRKPGD